MQLVNRGVLRGALWLYTQKWTRKENKFDKRSWTGGRGLILIETDLLLQKSAADNSVISDERGARRAPYPIEVKYTKLMEK